jgi:hypothetical protein
MSTFIEQGLLKGRTVLITGGSGGDDPPPERQQPVSFLQADHATVAGNR